jgi:glycosyltransferase involved in cell wall biosynthesis
VLASNRTSLPEVVGDAARTIDPTNVVAWRDALAQFLGDPVQRQHLRAAGMHRASRFSYDITATQTAAVYARIAARVL